MEADLATPIVRALIGAIICGLGVSVRTLFVRMREAESALAVLRVRESGSDESGRAALEQVQQLRLAVAEAYVRRDDYVMQMASVATKLDSIGVMVARVDERMRVHEGHHDPRPD